MAKNLNSVSFTVLLVVLVMASTGILKSEAFDCEVSAGTCSLSTQRVFSHECGPDPYPGTEIDCCNCCKAIPDPPPPAAPLPPFCWTAVEGTLNKHCHCYIKKV